MRQSIVELYNEPQVAVNHSITTYREELFHRMYSKYYPAIVYFAYGLIKDRAVSEDMATDAFVKLWTRLKDDEEFGTAEQSKAFLYITTKRACLNYLRHLDVRSHHNKEMLHRNEFYEEATVLRSMIRAEVIREILEVINTLPESRKKIFILHYREGLTNVEISELLGISISTVKAQKARVMIALRERFNEK